MVCCSVSRRAVLQGVLALGVGSLAAGLAACAPASPAPAASPTPPQPSAAATPKLKGKLVFWGHATHPQDWVKEAFQKKYPEVECVWEHSGDWFTKLQAALAAGEGTPDLVWTEAGVNQDFGCRDLLLDITEQLTPIKDQFLPHKLEECFIAKTGKYVSIPSDAGNLMAWYYRPDLLEKAGWKEEIPDDWTYDMFFEITEMVKKNLGAYTFCFPKSGWSALWAMTLHQLGGSLYDSTGTKMTGCDEIGVEAMRLVKKLWDSGGGLDVEWWSPPYWAAVKAGQLVGDFAAGWARGFIEAEVKTEQEGLGKWRLALLPKAPDGVSQTAVWGGANLSSPKFTKVPELVWAYMEFAQASMEGCAILDAWGTTPAWIPYRQTSQFLDRTVPLFGDWKFNQLWEKAAASINPKFYRKAGYDTLMGVVQTEMMPMILGDISVEDGMKQLEAKLQAEHERVGCF
jgi:ABC-type glycerol-3-phosphate transport system substrate-binding protein